MAYTAIDDPSAYFQVVLFTGTGSEQAITLGGDTDMSPDLVIAKTRAVAHNHGVQDSVRGATKELYTETTAAEATYAETLKSFDSDGFTVGTDGGWNSDGDAKVAWCWKAGTAFSNDASATGVGNTDSSGSASSTAGFSICKYTGAGASLDITVKHGLSVKPTMFITKNLEDANSWAVYHGANTSAPETDYLKLDTTTATIDNGEIWLDTAPTSAIFTAGDHSSSNRSGDDFVSYFWNDVQGFSRFGTFEGNGNADGTFVNTGFRPAFVMTKSIDSTSSWHMFDNKREGYNVDNDPLVAEASTVEATTDMIDILSNGFKLRIATDPNVAETYVYMAFAEAPFVNSNGVPCNAR